MKVSLQRRRSVRSELRNDILFSLRCYTNTKLVVETKNEFVPEVVEEVEKEEVLMEEITDSGQ